MLTYGPPEDGEGPDVIFDEPLAILILTPAGANPNPSLEEYSTLIDAIYQNRVSSEHEPPEVLPFIAFPPLDTCTRDTQDAG